MYFLIHNTAAYSDEQIRFFVNNFHMGKSSERQSHGGEGECGGRTDTNCPPLFSREQQQQQLDGSTLILQTDVVVDNQAILYSVEY